jgi:hypothetical protein
MDPKLLSAQIRERLMNEDDVLLRAFEVLIEKGVMRPRDQSFAESILEYKQRKGFATAKQLGWWRKPVNKNTTNTPIDRYLAILCTAAKAKHDAQKKPESIDEMSEKELAELEARLEIEAAFGMPYETWANKILSDNALVTPLATNQE